MNTVQLIVGVSGITCTAAGVVGLLYSLERQEPARSPTPEAPASITVEEGDRQQVDSSMAEDIPAQEAEHLSQVRQAADIGPTSTRLDTRDLLFYPLEVGRFWVYRFREGEGEGVKTEIVRTIERHQQRDGRDLYFFDDGTVAYEEKGRIFEMGADGGVNVVPVVPADAGRGETNMPYIYTSQGMIIEKQIGVTDTTVKVNGVEYRGCLEVITNFRSATVSAGREKSMSYSSFYAPEIGLVGRERLSAEGVERFSLELQTHGTAAAAQL